MAIVLEGVNGPSWNTPFGWSDVANVVGKGEGGIKVGENGGDNPSASSPAPAPGFAVPVPLFKYFHFLQKTCSSRTIE